ncbi:MAG TPA: hypothetical protein GX497_08250 [Bacillus bacterium]|nr:hypothetical protein [Bacillus sp. (in: firmicutes)]
MSSELIEQIEHRFKLWDSERTKLAHLFRNRNKQAAFSPMNKQIVNFLDLLNIINDMKFVNGGDILENMEKLDVKPINCKERLSFLMESPSHYHSFIQLSELFTELEKQYRKKVASTR